MSKEKYPLRRKIYGGTMQALMYFSVFVTCALVLAIIGYVLIKGLPNITWKLLSTKPSYLSNSIGILPDILNTIYIIIVCLVVVLPLGVGAAIYLTEYAENKKLVGVIEYAAETLSGIPSVVYGLVGMLILVPAIRKLFHVPDGASLLAAIIVLSVMVLPSIINVSMTSLEAVPKEYEEGSLALGATQIETYMRVSVPAAKSGIATAIVLGVGRALGEAMAVMMVSGNAANMPSLFQSVRFLTTAVASEMAYSSGLHRQALFSIALVLFLFIMLINAGLNLILKHKKEG